MRQIVPSLLAKLTPRLLPLVVAGALIPGLHGCANTGPSIANSPQTQGALLQVLNEDDIQLEPGMTLEIRARLVSGQKQDNTRTNTPLTGQVKFEIVGETESAFGREGEDGQSVTTATDNQGYARAIVLGSEVLGETFDVKASSSGVPSAAVEVTIAYPNLAGSHILDSELRIERFVDGFWGGLMSSFAKIGQSPGKWLIEDVFGIEAGSNIFTSILTSIAAAVIDNYVEDIIPEFIQDISDIAYEFMEGIERMHVETLFEVTPGEDSELDVDYAYVGNHTFRALYTEVDGEEIRIEASEMDFVQPEDYARDIELGYNVRRNRVEIEEHDIPVPYAGILNASLQSAMFTVTGQSYETLGDYFDDIVDCGAFADGIVSGQGLWSNIARGAVTGICNGGLGFINSRIQSAFGSENSVALLTVEGRTRRGGLGRGGFWKGSIAHLDHTVLIAGDDADGSARFRAKRASTTNPTDPADTEDPGAIALPGLNNPTTKTNDPNKSNFYF